MTSTPQKMKAYHSFDEWKTDQTTSNQALISYVETLVDTLNYNFVKIVKWGQGCWTFDGSHKFYIHAKEDHIQLGFYNGSQLKDPHKLLKGKGKYIRFVEIYREEDIDESKVTKLIEQVI